MSFRFNKNIVGYDLRYLFVLFNYYFRLYLAISCLPYNSLYTIHADLYNLYISSYIPSSSLHCKALIFVS